MNKTVCTKPNRRITAYVFCAICYWLRHGAVLRYDIWDITKVGLIMIFGGTKMPGIVGITYCISIMRYKYGNSLLQCKIQDGTSYNNSIITWHSAKATSAHCPGGVRVAVLLMRRRGRSLILQSNQIGPYCFPSI